MLCLNFSTDLFLLLFEEESRGGHGVDAQVSHLLQVVGLHVQDDGAAGQHCPQLKQRMQREGGHVGLGPPIAALLHVLLELDPTSGLKTILVDGEYFLHSFQIALDETIIVFAL
jgi:hypothetical protein